MLGVQQGLAVGGIDFLVDALLENGIECRHSFLVVLHEAVDDTPNGGQNPHDEEKHKEYDVHVFLLPIASLGVQGPEVGREHDVFG